MSNTKFRSREGFSTFYNLIQSLRWLTEFLGFLPVCDAHILFLIFKSKIFRRVANVSFLKIKSRIRASGEGPLPARRAAGETAMCA